MYFIPMGLFLKTTPEVVNAAVLISGKTIDLANLTWMDFVVKNLIPVTIGNIIGGGILVAFIYWFIFERK